MLPLPRGLSRLYLGLTTKNHERNNGVVSLRPRKRNSNSTHKLETEGPQGLPNSLSPLFLSRCIHDEKLTLRRRTHMEGSECQWIACGRQRRSGRPGASIPYRNSDLQVG